MKTVILKFIKITRNYWVYEAQDESEALGKIYIPKKDAALPPDALRLEVPE